MSLRAALVLVVLVSCGGTSPIVAGEIDASDRAVDETELTTGQWTTSMSGDTVVITTALRFVAPSTVESANGASGTHLTGTYAITPSGAIDTTIGAEHRRETFVVATDPYGQRVWSSLGLVSSAATPSVFWREYVRDDVAVLSRVTFETPLDATTTSCRARVEIALRIGSDRAALDETLACHVETRGAVRYVIFDDVSRHASDLEAVTDWINWCSSRRARWPARARDLIATAFAAALVWDPASPRALHAPYVAGLVATP